MGGKKRDVPFAGSHRILFFLRVGVFLIFLKGRVCVSACFGFVVRLLSKSPVSQKSCPPRLVLFSRCNRVSANGFRLGEGGDF